MLRHIVMWNFADGFSDKDNQENSEKIKSELESLVSLVREIVELRVVINPLSTGNVDIMLESYFENEAALAAYQIHPEHKRVAEFINAVTKNKKCIDYLT